MGRDLDEYLVHLRENASELRNLGKEWGMTEEEINACVEEALDSSTRNEVQKLKNSPKNIGRKLWGYFLFLLKLPLYFLLFFIAMTFVLNVVIPLHEPSERYISKVMQPYGYTVQRYIRLASLPLHRFFSITNMYEAECIIDNPFFEDQEAACDVCKPIKRVKDVNASDFPAAKFMPYLNVEKPIVFRKSLPQNVSYADLRKLYLESDGALNEGTFQFSSTQAGINSIQDLFERDQEELYNTSTSLQIKWETRSVLPSVFLRQLFPRPRFMSDKIEISLTKHIQLDGPNTPTYELPGLRDGGHQMYVVSSGKRRVLVKPRPHCLTECNSLLVVMEAGDMLLVSRISWRVFIGANGDEPSVGYLLALQL